jgi:tetratricopeptide (TPR) repeat protein
MLPADAGRTTATLQRLLADNLVQAGRGRRYRQHDLLRLYGRRRAEVVTGAAGRAAVQRRLFDWYLARTAAAIPLIFAEAVRLPVDLDTDAPEVRFATADAARSWLDEELDGLLEAIREAATGTTPRYAWLLADQLRGYFGIKRNGVPWLASGQYGLAAAEAAGDMLAQAAMYQTVGEAQRSFGQHHEALRTIERGVEAARHSGWLAGEANMTEDLALLNAELGRTDEALALFHRVLAIATGPELDGIRAFTLNDLGVLCMDLGRMQEAADHFESALEINRTDARRPSGMKNRVNLGIAQRQLGRLTAGQDNLETALAYFRETGSLIGQMASQDELSQLRAQRAEWHPAVDHGIEAVALAERLADPRSQAGVLITLAYAQLGLGSTADALDHFGRALRLARDGGYQYYEAQAGIGTADTLLTAGEPARATEIAAAALELARDRYRILEADALVVLARAATALGDEPAATQHGARARALYESEGAHAKLLTIDQLLTR